MLDLHLFQNRLFGFAAVAAALNGLARGAVLFVLIFFLQGHARDPLSAGLMMTPSARPSCWSGLSWLLIRPLRLASAGHSWPGRVSAMGLLGLVATITATTPYWLLALYMALMGGGSGLFTSPNVNAMIDLGRVRWRGSAAGISTMLANTGQMLSIAIAFPLVAQPNPQDIMFNVFLYGGGMGKDPEALSAFEQGVHQAFLVSFGITLVAVVVAFLRPSHSPRDEHEDALRPANPRPPERRRPSGPGPDSAASGGELNSGDALERR